MAYALEGQHWASTTVTWSFEQSGTSTQGGTPYSAAIANPVQQGLVQQAILDWQANSGLTFAQVPDHQDFYTAPDIRIGLASLLNQSDSSDTIGDTDYYYYPSDETFAPGITIALQDTGITPLHADRTGALVYQNSTSSFLGVALHELGHALGLAHDEDDESAIMNPTATAENRSLDADDIAGIQALYGAPHGQGTPANELFLSGAHTQYTLAQNGAGALSVIDGTPGRDGSTTVATDRFFGFTDGIAFSDPTGNGERIARLYEVTFHRAPDGLGLQSWTAAADNGEGLGDIADALAASPEGERMFGGLDTPRFIAQAYQNVLHRGPDAGGFGGFAGLIGSGAGRGQVLLDLAQSQEARAANLALAGDHSDAEVVRLYGTALGRAPDPTGLASWAGALDSGAGVSVIAQGLTGSQEFARLYGGMGDTGFVQALYRNTLHRGADPGGLAVWTGALAGGASRASVVIGFADSAENRILTAATTHDGVVFLPGG